MYGSHTSEKTQFFSKNHLQKHDSFTLTPAFLRKKKKDNSYFTPFLLTTASISEIFGGA